MTASLPPSYFDGLYAADPDPWRFATSGYERDKYAATLAALAARRFANALEVGCSIGVLTRALAPQCRVLLALDVAEAALHQARARCADLAQVRFERRHVPQDWPDGSYDLILLSEIVYYLSETDVDALADRVRGAITPGGAVLLVHWLGLTNYPLSGDVASERLIARLGFAPVRQRREPEYRLDLLAAPVSPGLGQA